MTSRRRGAVIQILGFFVVWFLLVEPTLQGLAITAGAWCFSHYFVTNFVSPIWRDIQEG